MDRQRLSSIAHTDHAIAAPLSEASMSRLLRRAGCPTGARVLDLGCGEAAWTLRALELYSDASADGVDISAWGLRRAEAAATALGVADRLTLHELDVNEFSTTERYGLVLCVGATHAFGGLAGTLAVAARYVQPDGRLLIGEGFWARPPDDPPLRALGASPDNLFNLPSTVEMVEECGWTPLYGHASEPGEWDDCEWSWSGSLARWALQHPADPDADAALALSREHRHEWLRGYRGVLGFICLVLRLTSPAAG